MFWSLTVNRVLHSLLCFLDSQLEMLHLWTSLLCLVVKLQRKLQFPHAVQNFSLLVQPLKHSGPKWWQALGGRTNSDGYLREELVLFEGKLSILQRFLKLALAQVTLGSPDQAFLVLRLELQSLKTWKKRHYILKVETQERNGAEPTEVKMFLALWYCPFNRSCFPVKTKFTKLFWSRSLAVSDIFLFRALS